MTTLNSDLHTILKQRDLTEENIVGAFAGVLMEPEVDHGETEVYARVQA